MGVRAAIAVAGSVFVFGCGNPSTTSPTESVTIALQTTVNVPTTSATTSVTTSAPTVTFAPEATIGYTVAAGDALWSIANQHCVTLDDLVATNGWSDSSQPIHPGDVIQVPDVPCTPIPPSATTAPDNSGTEVEWNLDHPDFLFTQIVFWDYADGGEYEGQFTDQTCVTAYWANFAIERGQTDDLDAAFAGLASLAIPVPDDVRIYMERKAAIFRQFANDLRRISEAYWAGFVTGAAPDYHIVARATAEADPAYPAIAEAFFEMFSELPTKQATTLIQGVCDPYQIRD